MKFSRKALPPILALLVGSSPMEFMPAGCSSRGTLVSETTDLRIRIDPRTGIAHVFETDHHMESEEADSAGRQKDFDFEAAVMSSDAGLALFADQGVYMRNPRFWLEPDGVHASYERMYADTAALAEGANLDVRSVAGCLCYRPEMWDSVVATNADVCVIDSATTDQARGDSTMVNSPYRYSSHFRVLLIWPLDGRDKWVTLRDRWFKDKHEFAAIYSQWVADGRPIRKDDE